MGSKAGPSSTFERSAGPQAGTNGNFERSAGPGQARAVILSAKVAPVQQIPVFSSASKRRSLEKPAELGKRVSGPPDFEQNLSIDIHISTNMRLEILKQKSLSISPLGGSIVLDYVGP